MVGKIVKGIAGFYYVHVPEKGVYECKAKGVFRNRNQKPLVGDLVTIEIIDASTSIGNIIQLQPRTNQLVRPAVANVDQAVVVFAVAEPEPNLHLLDYFLVRMEMENVPTIICFNKIDLISEETINDYSDMYRQCGYQTITASAQNDIGAEALLQIMENKTTVLAGPSGVGKSSIMNLLYPCAEVSTGEISKKLGRGKHTTRHSEIFCIGKETYLMDTPGFSSLKLPIMEPSELRYYFPEFRQYDDTCKFQGCLHNNEPFCMVKEGLENGVISRERYESYLLMLEEIQTQKKW